MKLTKLIKFLLLILIIHNLEADQLKFPDGRVEEFILLKQDRNFIKENQIFLRHNKIYQDSRKIYISFGHQVDIEKFCEKYNLTFLKVTNSYFYTALFKINDEQNVLNLCNKINKNESIRYAKPNWKRDRTLY